MNRDERNQIICELYVAGCARSEISMKVRVSIPTIDKVVRENGIQKRIDNHSARKLTLQERFERCVDRTNSSGCWTWTGLKSGSGYGAINYNNKKLSAHRVAYQIYKDDPGDLLVLHKCDNPICVNPEHLFLGTDSDNAKDKQVKGRCHETKGIKNANAKLSVDDILKIRELATLGISYSEIGRRFGISHNQASAIHKRKSWSHI